MRVQIPEAWPVLVFGFCPIILSVLRASVVIDFLWLNSYQKMNHNDTNGNDEFLHCVRYVFLHSVRGVVVVSFL